MPDYTLAVGTDDPHDLVAGGDAEAVQAAIELIRDRYAVDLRGNPQEVATLLGPSGLLTRPSERLDEFVARAAGTDTTRPLQTGDTGSPDCNGD